MSGYPTSSVPFNALVGEEDSVSSFSLDNRDIIDNSSRIPRARMRDSIRMKCLMQCIPLQRFDGSKSKVKRPKEKVRDVANGSFPLLQTQESPVAPMDHGDSEKLISSSMETLHFNVQDWGSGGGYDRDRHELPSVFIDGYRQDFHFMDSTSDSSDGNDCFSLGSVVSSTSDQQLNRYEAPKLNATKENEPWVEFESLCFSRSSEISISASGRSRSSSVSKKRRLFPFTTPPRTPSAQKPTYGQHTPGTEVSDDSLLEHSSESDAATNGGDFLAWDNILVEVGAGGNLDLPSFDEASSGDLGTDAVAVDPVVDDCTPDGFYAIEEANRTIGTDSDGDSSSESDIDDATSLCSRIDSRNLEPPPSLDWQETKAGDKLAKYIKIFYPNDDSANDSNSISFSDEEDESDNDYLSSSFQEEDSFLHKIEDIGPKSRSFDNLYHSSMASI